ncbi:MAG TPA: (4Fe-4S)-binding protein [Mucilaginibacter sp.]|jgi:uncharacterized Fe-S cluster protein YjdI|nr:(4Fe-4S)-binding protein [Mucilaginibacter sp.]
MEDNTKKYDNGEITMVWQPGLCVHSASCVNRLPSVFNAKSKPWINVAGADTAAIINQVGQCPSGLYLISGIK